MTITQLLQQFAQKRRVEYNFILNEKDKKFNHLNIILVKPIECFYDFGYLIILHDKKLYVHYNEFKNLTIDDLNREL